MFINNIDINIRSYQGCGVGRFFRIPTPTPAVLKNRLRLQLKTCDSTDSDSTTLAVTAVVAAGYL